MYDSINNRSEFYYHSEYYTFTFSQKKLYDSDMKNIVMRAKRMSTRYGLVTKAQLIRAFKEYSREYGLTVKIETFLRKLRYYAEHKRYLTYTFRKGVYKVLL